MADVEQQTFSSCLHVLPAECDETAFRVIHGHIFSQRSVSRHSRDPQAFNNFFSCMNYETIDVGTCLRSLPAWIVDLAPVCAWISEKVCLLWF
jgi:hypothetical protein